MKQEVNLGDFEQLVMLAVLRLDDDAYGTTIRHEIQRHSERQVTAGALYTTLVRLEHKGLVTSMLGEPTQARGGRAKRYYQVTNTGQRALASAQRAYQSLLQGLEILERV